jgi:hypothetical protein
MAQRLPYKWQLTIGRWRKMPEININNPAPSSGTVDSGGDRTAAAGINFLTVIVVLAVVAAVLWFLFTGPFRNGFSSGPTNVNVNPPAQQSPPNNVNVNPPQVNVNPPSAPAPAKP